MPTDIQYDPGVPRRRPVFNEQLGQYFRDLRTVRGLGLRQAANVAHRRKLSLLTLNTLGTLERGETKNPDPDLLKEVSTLYDLEYEAVVAAVVQHRYGIELGVRAGIGVDLIGHAVDQPSRFTPRGNQTDVPASAATARIQQLQQDLKDRDAVILATQEIARRLFRLVLPAQGGPARKPKSGRRQAH